MTDLEDIASYFEWWLQCQERERAREGLQTDDDTMIVMPPNWPNRRQIKSIIGAAQDAQRRIEELEQEVLCLRVQVGDVIPKD